MKKYLTIIIFFGLTSCNHVKKHIEAIQNDSIPVNKKDSPIVSSAFNVSDKIIDSLQKISFVMESNRQIDSISKHQHGIAFIIDSAEKEWMIQAGYNGKERFETYHRFYVNPSTMEIKVYDVINDERMSVADYLKKEN